jgi:hypothetical protein
MPGVAGSDRTPRMKRKTLPRQICPHCRKLRKVMPSGLFELHPVHGRWKPSMCRGSGEPAHPAHPTPLPPKPSPKR